MGKLTRSIPDRVVGAGAIHPGRRLVGESDLNTDSQDSHGFCDYWLPKNSYKSA
jgi:hypothetical protein